MTTNTSISFIQKLENQIADLENKKNIIKSLIFRNNQNQQRLNNEKSRLATKNHYKFKERNRELHNVLYYILDSKLVLERELYNYKSF